MNGTFGRVGGEVIELVVLFGGRSAEHEISCITASHVVAAIDQRRHPVTLIGIDREGRWHEAEMGPDGLNATGPVVEPTQVLRARSGAVVLPLLHGPLGEDGTVQGLLELMDLPYVGSGVLGSAVAMDKAMAKVVLTASGIPQAAHTVVTDREYLTDPDHVVERVRSHPGLPCFVKPANMGSSVGVSRVDGAGSLVDAIEAALSYDRTVVIEEAIGGREIEVAVLGSDDPFISAPGEIIPGDHFYSYADKYLDGRSRTVVPADLDEPTVERVRDLARQAFRALRCDGLARCDFFLSDDGRGVLLNEVNTMPGFTPISMFPKMMEASGVPYGEIIERLIELALERHAARPRRVDF